MEKKDYVIQTSSHLSERMLPKGKTCNDCINGNRMGCEDRMFANCSFCIWYPSMFLSNKQ